MKIAAQPQSLAKQLKAETINVTKARDGMISLGGAGTKGRRLKLRKLCKLRTLLNFVEFLDLVVG